MGCQGRRYFLVLKSIYLGQAGDIYYRVRRVLATGILYNLFVCVWTLESHRFSKCYFLTVAVEVCVHGCACKWLVLYTVVTALPYSYVRVSARV